MAKIKHGHSLNSGRSPTYTVWRNMKNRCLNENVASYKDYGGRGISVCERWLDFINFLADMGARPKDMTLERIDNNGNYEPGNCRWATFLEQGSNTRKNVFYTFHGVTLTLSWWARLAGMKCNILHTRLGLGWDFARAVSEPVKTRRISRAT